MKRFAFLRKKTTKQSDDWRNATDWYKAPVLAGPENEYGTYDYMVEQIPESSSRWHYQRDGSFCDDCGKLRRCFKRDVTYFHTLDGYDYMDYHTCWRCELARKLRLPIRRTGKHRPKPKF